MSVDNEHLMSKPADALLNPSVPLLHEEGLANICNIAEKDAISQDFRERFALIFKEDIQVMVFYADIWKSMPGVGKHPLFRHIRRLKQEITASKEYVLLIVGSDQNCLEARELLLKSDVIEDSHEWIYQPQTLPKAVTRKPIIDMHVHSVYSDGSLTPLEIIQEAKRKRLKAISITDHDTLDAYIAEPRIFDEARANGVQLVAGVEVGALVWSPQYSKVGGYRDVHLVIYFPRNVSAETEQDYVKRLTDINEKMNSHGTMPFLLRCMLLLFQLKKDFPEVELSFKDFVDWLQNINDKNGIQRIDVSWMSVEDVESFEFWHEKMSKVDGKKFFEKHKLPAKLHPGNIVIYAVEKIKNVEGCILPGGIEGYDVQAFYHYIVDNPDHYFGKPGPDTWYVSSVEEIQQIVRENQGKLILAHPCEMRPHIKDKKGLEDWVREVKFDGIEAFYGVQSGIESLYLNAYDGVKTCSSDFHGENIPGLGLGAGMSGYTGMQTTIETVDSLIDSGILAPEMFGEIEWQSTIPKRR